MKVTLKDYEYELLKNGNIGISDLIYENTIILNKREALSLLKFLIDTLDLSFEQWDIIEDLVTDRIEELRTELEDKLKE